MDGRWAACAAVVLAGCASTQPRFSTGLEAAAGGSAPSPLSQAPAARVESGSDLESLLRQSALDTQRALDELKAASVTPEAPGVGGPAPAAVREMPHTEAEPAAAPALLAAPEPPEPMGPPAPAGRDTLRRSLVAELREHLTGAADPWPDLLALAALDPQALAQQADVVKGLTGPQRRAALALPALLAELPRDADAGRVLAERAEALAGELADQRPMAVRAELCRRVVGFGSYTAFGVNRFAAGTEQRAVVYVEVANLPQRELGPADTSLARQPGDRFLVDLTQETNLYNESGSLLALHVPEQRLAETSRNRRRDFFLVSQVTLPPSLSIGLYNLKVTVRDRVTGAQAEASIPIEIVAP